MIFATFTRTVTEDYC